VVIAAWTMMCFFSSAVIVRIMTRFLPVRVNGTDDIVIGLSMVGGQRPESPRRASIEANQSVQMVGIAQTATIHVSAFGGLGRHLDTLSYDSYEVFARAYYASDMLFAMTIYLAKVSLVLFIMRLSPSHRVVYSCLGLIAALTLWMLGIVFSLAFQCPLSRPWDFMPLHLEKCGVNIAAVYFSIGAVDILSDAIIIATPGFIVWNVQISRRQRCTVIGVFASRLAVCVCSGLLLVSIPAFIKSTDRSWEALTPQIWRQAVQCTSIITACIPCLRPFLVSLESGFMDSSMQGVIGKTYGGGSGQGSGRNNGTGSFALTSFTLSGRMAIIIPRSRNKVDDVEGNESKELTCRPVAAASLLSPRSPETTALQQIGHSEIDKRAPICVSPNTKASGSRRECSKGRDTSYQAGEGRSTKSVNMLASRTSRRSHESLQPGNANKGCIRETREVVISIEREGARLIDGVLCTHGTHSCSTFAREQQLLHEHSGYCSS
jgi:hypothetical protein